MSIDISRIKAICFDIDGTLRDTDDSYTLKFKKYLDPFRIIFPNKDASKFARWLVMAIETPANYIFEIPDHLNIDDDIARIQNFFRHKKQNKKIRETLIIEGVVHTIKTLKEYFPLSVVTARPAFGTYHFLEQHNLTSYFIGVAHGQTTQYTKPYPDPILWCAEKMGCEPNEILMIGDTRPDMVAGKKAGAQTIGVLSGFGTKDELIYHGADLILNNVNELVELLLSSKID